MKTTILEKFIEFLLLLFLILLPFSYSYQNVRHGSVMFILTILFCIILLYNKFTLFKLHIWKIIIAILFIYIFDFTEKVDFMQQFGLSLGIARTIPISTILISLMFLIYLVKYISNGKVRFPTSQPAKYLLNAFVFLFIASIILLPSFFITYHMHVNADFLLFNKIFKYLIILLVVTNYIDNRNKTRRIAIPLTISLGLNVIISMAMFIISN